MCRNTEYVNSFFLRAGTHESNVMNLPIPISKQQESIDPDFLLAMQLQATEQRIGGSHASTPVAVYPSISPSATIQSSTRNNIQQGAQYVGSVVPPAAPGTGYSQSRSNREQSDWETAMQLQREMNGVHTSAGSNKGYENNLASNYSPEQLEQHRRAEEEFYRRKNSKKTSESQTESDNSFCVVS